MISDNKGVATEIALLTRTGKEMLFQWQSDLTASASPSFFRNTILELSSSNFSSSVGLRKAANAPAIRSGLQQRTTYAVDMTSPPKLDDVYVEFVPHDGSRVGALGESVVPAIDGKLRLGVEAGKESLIVVQVVSLMKKRRGLQLIPLGRLTADGTLAEIKKKSLASWKAGLMTSRRESKALQQVLRRAETGKRALQKHVRRLRGTIEQQEKLLKALEVAVQQQFNLRIFRKIGDHELDLFRFGAVSR